MSNPFFEAWTTPFAAPSLDRIKPEHFRPAYDRALAEHAAEVAAIAEFWLEKPVIAINTATYWHALRSMGMKDQKEGYGRLLSHF